MNLSISQEKPPLSIDQNLRLKDVIKTLPPEVFVKNSFKAWSTLVFSLTCVILGYIGIAIAPEYLLPFFWFFTGTALTGLFVIAHDCGHRSFSNNNWLNNTLGQLLLLPLIYPFHAWRYHHDHHHKHTNKLGIDNAWDALTPEFYAQCSPFMKFVNREIRGNFWWLGSIGHWAMFHFNWQQFEGKQRDRVKFSIFAVIAFAVIFFPLLIFYTGIWGFVKFWVLPWLCYHFWMSTFTLIHHTMPDIPFKTEDKWNEVEAQLRGSVHCNYPRWVEIMCHDINVHVPHHLSPGIPWYNLRSAHQSIKENWQDYLYQECNFSWDLMKNIINNCHLYDAQKIYVKFDQ